MDEKMKELLAEYTDADLSEITEETDFRADLGMDSLQLADLASRLENEYGITLSDRDAMNIRTAGDVMRLIEE